jgi:hypothetical protein
MTTILGLLSMLFIALYLLWVIQGVARLVFQAILNKINRRY